MSPDSLDEALARIRDDREHGAAQLAEAGLRLIGRVCGERARAGADTLLADAATLVGRIAALRPSMASPGNWAATYYAALRERLANPGTDPAQACDEVLADLLARQAALRDALVAAARPVLAAARGVLTLSYSSTIEAVLAEAIAPDCLVVVAESRPLLEGRKLCGRLEAAGRRVRCITDAQIGLALADLDTVLIGADAVLADLAVVNKAGSLLAALAARERGTRCHVAADTFKIDPRATAAEATLEAMDGGEVWPERAEICINVYFETVPADLIGLYLTEKGALTAPDMLGEVDAWRALWRTPGLAA